MTTIDVPLGDRSYQILVRSGLLENAGREIASRINASSAIVLTHPHLSKLYAEPVIDGLERAGIPARLLTIPPGERSKSLSTVARLYDLLVDAGVDRQSILVTVGGGVIGDIGGFVAATILRGIAYVQVPTTLLAQVDASIGGKTGVDMKGGKNLVGAFHQPRAVLIDTDTLRTLPTRELRSGLAEVIKYGIIRDKGLFDRLESDIPKILQAEQAAVSNAIVRSCEIKAEVVGEDETEAGLRAILNFGHTVAHAIEAITNYRRFKHGEAVAIGMLSAAMIGEELHLTPPAVTQQIYRTLSRAQLPQSVPEDVSADQILTAIQRDKKTVAGRLTFVLARAIGETEIVKDVPARAVAAALNRQKRMK